MSAQLLPGATGIHGFAGEARFLDDLKHARETFLQALRAAVPASGVVPLYAAADGWVKAQRAYTRACYPAECYGVEDEMP